jgi:hypothetical protein
MRVNAARWLYSHLRRRSPLGHFLAHYQRAGVAEFFIAVAGDLGSAVRQFMPTYPITLCEALGVADNYPFGVNAATEMRKRYLRSGEWASSLT